ncbi:MAG TPA: AAA family ATPase [Candidatus Sulfotelmatobacter sp.]|jgi:general secretion pathway protein A|nr:AAA family ATPase [Candidatus Sulfotelmatobacter sp.]
MYKLFFGLRENPFNINPDPRFLHRTSRVQEALDQLTYGVQNRKGLLLLTGEVGTGKTTLINHLLDWLRERQIPTAFIFNSHLKPNHLFDFILNDFGISTDYRLVSNMLLELNQWLIQRFRAGSTPVLIVDEAQGLSLELLEEIRLLLNLETASEKLLQIVLVGQPELEEKLKRPEMRQLRQRIALRCNTAPLTFEESRGYIADRLRIAGAASEPIFDSDAVEALYYYSHGIPRVMNLLCEHALINAYVEGLNPVPPQMVEEAARDFLMEEFRPLSPHFGMPIHSDCKLTVMHSDFTSETEGASREDAGGLLKEIGAQRTATSVGFADEEREPSGQESMIATAPEEEQEEGSAASEVESDSSLSILDLVPASPGIGSQQVDHRFALNPSVSQSDCAAELVATMGRLLAAAASPPRVQQEPSNVESERSPALTLNRPGNCIGPVVSRSMWSGVSARVLRAAREAMAAAGVVLRQWKLEFRHDWKLTVAALNLLAMKKSIGHWLQQPLSPKPMASGKNQTV